MDWHCRFRPCNFTWSTSCSLRAILYVQCTASNGSGPTLPYPKRRRPIGPRGQPPLTSHCLKQGEGPKDGILLPVSSANAALRCAYCCRNRPSLRFHDEDHHDLHLPSTVGCEFTPSYPAMSSPSHSTPRLDTVNPYLCRYPPPRLNETLPLGGGPGVAPRVLSTGLMAVCGF